MQEPFRAHNLMKLGIMYIDDMVDDQGFVYLSLKRLFPLHCKCITCIFGGKFLIYYVLSSLFLHWLTEIGFWIGSYSLLLQIFILYLTLTSIKAYRLMHHGFNNILTYFNVYGSPSHDGGRIFRCCGQVSFPWSRDYFFGDTWRVPYLWESNLQGAELHLPLALDIGLHKRDFFICSGVV